MDLKEYILPLNSMIGGWYIDPKVCDNLIKFFKENKSSHFQGTIGPPERVDITEKESTEFIVKPNYPHIAFMHYRALLDQARGYYVERYPELKTFSKYDMIQDAKIQHYRSGGGFKQWHFERSSLEQNRCLVFMTYLNDVPHGGTHFKYQNIITPAEKGLTLIWPTDFTHTHKGQISKNHEKYIITGWWGFV